MRTFSYYNLDFTSVLCINHCKTTTTSLWSAKGTARHCRQLPSGGGGAVAGCGPGSTIPATTVPPTHRGKGLTWKPHNRGRLCAGISRLPPLMICRRSGKLRFMQSSEADAPWIAWTIVCPVLPRSLRMKKEVSLQWTTCICPIMWI